MRLPSLSALPDDDLVILGSLGAQHVPYIGPAVVEAVAAERSTRAGLAPRTATHYAFPGQDTPEGSGTARNALASWLTYAQLVLLREQRDALVDFVHELLSELDDERRLIDRAPYAYDLIVDGERGALISDAQ